MHGQQNVTICCTMFLFILYYSDMSRPHFLAIIRYSFFTFITDFCTVSFEERLKTEVWTRQITSVST